jgi:hypothetical protein
MKITIGQLRRLIKEGAQIPELFTSYQCNKKDFWVEGGKAKGIGSAKFGRNLNMTQTAATSTARKNVIRAAATQWDADHVKASISGIDSEYYFDTENNMMYSYIEIPTTILNFQSRYIICES